MSPSLSRSNRPLLVLLPAVLAGCASPTVRPAPVQPPTAVYSASLVLPAPSYGGQEATARSRSWEYGRNDRFVSYEAIPPAYRERAWVRIRTRDRIRTSNGRPREFSRTEIDAVTLRYRH